VITTILLGLIFLALVALAAWWLDRQTVEVEHVEHWHVHAEPLYDWAVRVPELRPLAVVITPEEWDSYLCVPRNRQPKGAA